jgi:hypothetical protein
MRIETTTNDRKGLAKAVAEFLDVTLHYMGPPTFAYLAGNYAIGRDGVITSDNEEGEAELREFLESNGYIERPTDELNIQMPVTESDTEAMKRLLFMLHSKQYLLNRAVGSPCFAVSGALVEALENTPLDSWDALTAFVAANGDGCKGFCLEADKFTMTFARSDDAARNTAYVKLVAAMLTKAREATRVSPTEQKPENEKYYFRIWLLQIGFGGSEYKTERKILMQNLKGYAAFRTNEAADQFKANMKAKRAAAKALKPEPPNTAAAVPVRGDPELFEALADEVLIQQVNASFDEEDA